MKPPVDCNQVDHTGPVESENAARRDAPRTAFIPPCGCRPLLLVLALIVPTWASEPNRGGGERPSPKVDVEDEYELQRMLVDTLDQVERNYVTGISRRELIEAAIDGILRKLDPYSDYIARDELDQFRTSMESQFGGIGIQVTIEGGQLQVLSPLVNTPAYRAGILAGDRIVEIDGKPTKNLGLTESVRMLKGKTGEDVVLTVVHPGRSQPEKITVKRQRIQLDTVLGDRRAKDDAWDFMYDRKKGIGYIRVTAFSRSTADELRQAVSSLKKQNLNGLILDLRSNPGGLLSSAIEVSDMFVEKGRIVSTSGRNVTERVWEAREANTFSGFPMVILVNRFTASAAEIVAACLQDHKRAVVMGERTWGKGSVQNVIPLEHGNSALKLTTASYCRPSGKNIHRFPNATDEDDWGVTPNEGHRVELSSRELVALIVERRRRDIIHSNGSPERTESPDKVEPPAADAQSSDPAKETGPEETLEDPVAADRVLKMALDYLGGEMAKAD
ncbi:MAG TPA: S41 family peptidase [Planctomycetaceae bacterium]|nr:S41 family peptidase [Planctomycetaceae bacterium]